MYSNQFGRNHSTSMAFIQLVHSIASSTDNRELTVGVFLHLSKAYHTIGHHVLLSKLQKYAVLDSSPWLNLQLPVQYSKQFVPFGSACSQQELITFCVIQGSILASLLFYIFYINDLPNASNVVNTLLFAHNTNLFYSRQ